MPLNGYVQVRAWVHAQFTHRQCQSPESERSTTYLESRLRTVKSAVHGWPRISCFEQFPLGLRIAREVPFGCYYHSYSVKFVAVRPCQGKYKG